MFGLRFVCFLVEPAVEGGTLFSSHCVLSAPTHASSEKALRILRSFVTVIPGDSQGLPSGSPRELGQRRS
jgi:hypothetical protein